MTETSENGGGRRPPIIAIGASAGGLEPLEAFFEAAPTDAGWAFFVIQHLSPDYRSMMDELLARRSKLRIRHCEGGMPVEPDTIYLNPPNTIVMVEGDAIVLEPFQRGELPNMPIDAFFHSLATQQARGCFAIVLSGSGTDGARGAAAIQKAGGKVLVQTPHDAKFDSMPRAVIASGTVDRVLDPAEMPGIIKEIVARGDALAESGRSELPADPHEAILTLLERNHRLDFGAYKKATVLRRIDRRRVLRGLPGLDAYRDQLAADPVALEELYHDLLIGVTEFYRDPQAFAALERLALPSIVVGGDPSREIRVWVPACASGEEAYSLAIALTETMRASGVDRPLRVIATDVHRGSIEAASAGVYPQAAVDKLPPALRERYFREHGHGVAVDPSIRRKVIFSVHNALTDPPFLRLDLISCRNLMIYLDDPAQARLLTMFQFGLRKDGYLFLGASESLGQQAEDFVPVDSHWRLFRWKGERRTVDSLAVTATFNGGRPPPRIGRTRPVRPTLDSVERDRPTRLDRSALLRGYDALLKRHAPSSLLVSAEGEVLTWFGDASDYVDTVSDLVERTVEEIVQEGLHYAINVGIERIRRNKEARYERRVELDMADGRRRLLLGVEPLERGEAPRHFLISIAAEEPAAADRPGRLPEAVDPKGDEALMARRIRELERDLKLTEESLQYVTERLETSGEELQASNEELQASNEELQASNEELQSSNEELHAVNEELVTVSAEHQRKIEQLIALHADTELVFNALEMGVVILDDRLTIRRITDVAAGIFELMPHDVGRPLANVGARLGFADPPRMARRALETGAPQWASGVFGNEALLVKAVPYRHDEVPDGVALLLIRPDRLAEAERRSDGEQTAC